MKKLTALILAAVLLFALPACSSTEKGDQVLSSKGVSITLPSDFYVVSSGAIDNPLILTGFSNAADDIAIYVITETRSELGVDSSFTADDYLDAQREYSTGNVISAVREQDGVKYFTYTVTQTDNLNSNTYHFLNTAYLSGDNFYYVQFCCRSELFDAKKDSFIAWAKTVSFS